MKAIKQTEFVEFNAESLDQNTHFKIQIIRSRRRTMSLQVNLKSQIIMKVPLRIKEKEINSLITKHQKWILKQKNKLKQYREKLFINGEDFLFLGKTYKLNLIYEENNKNYQTSLNKINFDNNFFLNSHKSSNAKNLFIKWYKEQAKIIIEERVDFYSKKMNLKYNSIKINSAKTRWGSCSIRKTLNFSYRIIMAPIEVIDYVIVHELAHTKEMNHQKKFWNIVISIMPNYKIHKKWLKDNGHNLNL